MSVKHAVLGLVIERPGYGYELIQRLSERIGAWKPSATAVYPALQGLSNDELIRERTDGAGHRGVVWYEATPSGREHFRSWMDAASNVSPLREELLVKIAFASVEDLPRLIEMTREQEQACRDRILELADAEAPLPSPGAQAQAPAILRVLVRDAELIRVKSTITMLQTCRSTMKDVLRRYGEGGPDRGRA